MEKETAFSTISDSSKRMLAKSLTETLGFDAILEMLITRGEIEYIKPYHKGAVFVKYKGEKKHYVVSMRIEQEAGLG